jgi:hypothetical protein
MACARAAETHRNGLSCPSHTYASASATSCSFQRYTVLPCLAHGFVVESSNVVDRSARVEYDLNALSSGSGFSAAETTV